ncbi:MAG: KH domain-containing protein [Bacilli bacterium]|jgi:hypothetical protein
MDYEKIIHALIDPIVENKDIIMIRELPSDSPRDVVLLIVAENEDTARLIGRKGSIANALRELLSVAGKTDSKRLHIKFESFEEKNED